MSWNMARLGKILGLVSLGLGVVLLLLGSVVGVHAAGYGRQAHFRGLLDTELALASRASAVETAMVQLRRNAKDFLLYKDAQYRERFEATYATLRTDMDALTSLAQRSGDTTLADNMTTMARYGTTYADTFQQVVAAWDKRGLDLHTGLQGAFREVAHTLATTIVRYDVDDLYHELLLLRRWEQEVVGTDDVLSTRRLLETLERYQALLDQGTYAAHIKQAQQTALARYAEALSTYLAPTTTSTSQAQSYATMRALAHELQEALEQVRIPESLALALQLRREEKHYLLHRAPQDVDGTHRAIMALQNRVKSSPVAPVWVATIVALLAQYQQRFDALVATDGEVTALTKSMQETIHQIGPLLESIKATNRGTMRARAKAISDVAIHRTAGDLGLGMAAVIVSGLVAWTIRRMIRSLQQLATVATQLTAGAWSVRNKNEMSRIVILRNQIDNALNYCNIYLQFNPLGDLTIAIEVPP